MDKRRFLLIVFGNISKYVKIIVDKYPVGVYIVYETKYPVGV